MIISNNYYYNYNNLDLQFPIFTTQAHHNASPHWCPIPQTTKPGWLDLSPPLPNDQYGENHCAMKTKQISPYTRIQLSSARVAATSRTRSFWRLQAHS